MKKLSELYNIDSDVEIKDIKINSKEVEPGDLFVCTKGVTADRHDFIPDAIKNGASALVVSKDVDTSIPTVKVEDTNKELPLLCSRFYNHPEDKLYMIGVTGTDGKTSVSTISTYLLNHISKAANIGTNGIFYNNQIYDNLFTTPILCENLIKILVILLLIVINFINILMSLLKQGASIWQWKLLVKLSLGEDLLIFIIR